MAFINVDGAKFRADVKALLAGTELWKQIQGGLILNVHQPEASLECMGQLVQHIIASVEVIKQNIIAEHVLHSGDPADKFDPQMAFETAVDVLHDTISFGGPWHVGDFLNLFDRPFLMWLVKVAITAWHGKVWVGEAAKMLTLVV